MCERDKLIEIYASGNACEDFYKRNQIWNDNYYGISWKIGWFFKTSSFVNFIVISYVEFIYLIFKYFFSVFHLVRYIYICLELLLLVVVVSLVKMYSILNKKKNYRCSMHEHDKYFKFSLDVNNNWVRLIFLFQNVYFGLLCRGQI